MVKPGELVQYTATIEPAWTSQEVEWSCYDIGWDNGGVHTQYSSITPDGYLYVEDREGAKETTVEVYANAKADPKVFTILAVMVGDETIDNPQ